MTQNSFTSQVLADLESDTNGAEETQLVTKIASPVGDISSLFATKKHAVMEIIDPTSGNALVGQNGKPMGLMLADKNCEACQRVTTEFRRKHAATKVAPAEGELLDYQIDLLAAAIVGFENIIQDGQLVVYSPEAARELMEMAPVIRAQVDRFLGADSNFMKGA